MSQFKILLTGDYWHDDFRLVLQESQCPITLTPLDSVTSGETDVSGHQLVVVACSRRDQFSESELESLVAMAKPAPVILLLGSWCEGESRSGQPIPGIQRVYWHQWQGRIDRFARCMDGESESQWHLPRTANDADKILIESAAVGRAQNAASQTKANGNWLGVSAATEHSYDMVRDAVGAFGWQAMWIEFTTWEAKEVPELELIFIDANSWSVACELRAKWIREQFKERPIVLLINFPRSEELQAATDFGIDAVVSKPFQLNDINAAIQKSLGRETVKR